MIGDFAMIGAGSVVVKDVPTGSVVAGNPVRILRIRPQSVDGVLEQHCLGEDRE